MNRAMRFRIEPNKDQRALFEKTFGCCRFVYNRMLTDRKLSDLTGERIKTTPASYKKEFPWLREVDSLALANVQLHLESAYQRFFENGKAGHPKFKTKHRSRKSYTTNVVNGNPDAPVVRVRREGGLDNVQISNISTAGEKIVDRYQ